jgi:hypothetical protein
MVDSSTRGDMVDLLDRRVRNRFKTHLKWQFDIHTSWIRSKSNTSVKVIMFRAPKLLENELNKELHSRYNSGQRISFYPWSEFLDLSEEQQDNIVKKQL